MTMLVTRTAPNFRAKAIMADNSVEDFDLFQYLGNRRGVVFFFPLAFTFVCPTEIVAFDHRMKQFEERNTCVIGVSVDSHFVQLAWKNTPLEKGGIGPVRFPLVSDITKSIAQDYGVLVNDAVALRGSFLIDQEKIVRHQVVNDLPLGRDVDEMLRIVDALGHYQTHGEVCPAGWRQNKPSMAPTAEQVAAYLEQHGDAL